MREAYSLPLWVMANAGNIEVQVGKLTLTGGAQIFSGTGFHQFKDGVLIIHGTGGPGRGGNLTVHATEAILISGLSSQGLPSGPGTVVQKGSGDGGQLFVSAPILELRDGGVITSSNWLQSTGNVGDIRIEVGKLTVDGGFITAYTLTEGDAGDIDVQVGTLTLRNGGQIFTGTGLLVFNPDGSFTPLAQSTRAGAGG